MSRRQNPNHVDDGMLKVKVVRHLTKGDTVAYLADYLHSHGLKCAPTNKTKLYAIVQEQIQYADGDSLVGERWEVEYADHLVGKFFPELI
jgi:hypothetical protein